LKVEAREGRISRDSVANRKSMIHVVEAQKLQERSEIGKGKNRE